MVARDFEAANSKTNLSSWTQNISPLRYSLIVSHFRHLFCSYVNKLSNLINKQPKFSLHPRSITRGMSSPSHITAAIKVMDDLEELLQQTMPQRGNIKSGSRYTEGFLSNLSQSPNVQKANKKWGTDKAEQIVMDQETYKFISRIDASTIDAMITFLWAENIAQRLHNRLHMIFSTYTMHFFDEKDAEVKDSVFNRAEVKHAIRDFFIKVAADILSVGISVLAIPKDIISWIGFDSIWGSLYNPAVNTTKGHVANKGAMNHMAQRSSQNSTDILPFSRVDPNSGNLLEYYNTNTASRVFLFQPTSAHSIALQKKFRTVVILHPFLHPENGQIRTGLYKIYMEWCRYRMMLTIYEGAVEAKSKNFFLSEYHPDNTKLQGMPREEIGPILNRIDVDFTKSSLQNRELATIQAGNRSAGPQTSRMLYGLFMKGSNQMPTRRGVLSETREDVMQGYAQFTDSGKKAVSLRQISAAEHDAREYATLDTPDEIGYLREKMMLLTPPGTTVKQFIPAEANPQSVMLAEARFDREVERLFDLIINAGTPNDTLGGGRAANTATQVQASEVAQFRSEGNAMTFITQIFDFIYGEWGAVLDQVGLVETISRITEELRRTNMMKVLQIQITESADLAGVTVDDVLEYLATSEGRNAIQSQSRRRKHLDPGGEGAQLVALTLDNFKNLDAIMRSALGKQRLLMVLHRTLSQGDTHNLHLKFEKRMEQFMKDQLANEAMGTKGAAKKKQDSENTIKSASKEEIADAASYMSYMSGDGSLAKLVPNQGDGSKKKSD